MNYVVYKEGEKPNRAFRRAHKKCKICSGKALVVLNQKEAKPKIIACPEYV